MVVKEEKDVKKFFVLAVLIFLLLVVPQTKATYQKINNYVARSVCDVPISYKIGSIDTRFGVSQDQFLSDIFSAVDIWNNSISKKLFDYNSSGELTLNLVYDERQTLHNQIESLEGKLKGGETGIKAEISQYERLSSLFKEKLNAFNNEVSYWNNKGGAPKEEFDKLKQQQQELQEEAEKLNEMARSLNQETRQYNTQVGTLNQTVQSFNQALQQKPEEGIYFAKEQKIDIYFNFNKQELTHTLAHELGHALGIGHVQTPLSIMYPFTTQTTVASSEDIELLSEICQRNYLQETFRAKVSELVSKYVSTSL